MAVAPINNYASLRFINLNHAGRSQLRDLFESNRVSADHQQLSHLRDSTKVRISQELSSRWTQSIELINWLFNKLLGRCYPYYSRTEFLNYLNSVQFISQKAHLVRDAMTRYSTVESRLELATELCAEVRRETEVVPNDLRRFDRFKNMYETDFKAAAESERKRLDGLRDADQPKTFFESALFDAERIRVHKIGNCGEMASLAMIKAIFERGIWHVPIETIEIDSLGTNHVVVLIGKNPLTTYRECFEKDEGAVVCDPHTGIAFKAVDYRKHAWGCRIGAFGQSERYVPDLQQHSIKRVSSNTFLLFDRFDEGKLYDFNQATSLEEKIKHGRELLAYCRKIVAQTETHKFEMGKGRNPAYLRLADLIAQLEAFLKEVS